VARDGFGLTGCLKNGSGIPAKFLTDGTPVAQLYRRVMRSTETALEATIQAGATNSTLKKQQKKRRRQVYFLGME